MKRLIIMKRFVIAGGILALSTGLALAASDIGTVTQIDAKNDAMTLSDGKSFAFAEGVEADMRKVGQTVEVTCDIKSGKMVASKIVARYAEMPATRQRPLRNCKGFAAGLYWTGAGGGGVMH